MKPISKINLRTLGDPKEFLTIAPKEEKRWLFGTIFGAARGLSKRASADGQGTQEGLQGSFEAIPLKELAARSSALFLPSDKAEQYLRLFRGPNPPSALHFGVDVFVNRADNADGYTWELVPVLTDVDKADPLEIVRQKIEAIRAAAAKAATKHK